MNNYIQIMLLCSMMMTASIVVAQDDVTDKIIRLEQQIAELKALKERQKFSAEKEDHCIKAVGRDNFCKCLADGLPSDITFEQYIHFVITSKTKLNYETMTTTQKLSVDKSLELREKCLEKKGFFK